MLLCLTACNGAWGLNKKATIVDIERYIVIIPEPIPEDLLSVPVCREIDEITWGDARDASDEYRRCKDLRGQRIKDIAVTVRGRWEWLRNQQPLVDDDSDKIRAAADKD